MYGTEMPLTIRYALLYSEIVASRVFKALVFSYVASTLVECHEYYSRLFLIILGVSSREKFDPVPFQATGYSTVFTVLLSCAGCHGSS